MKMYKAAKTSTVNAIIHGVLVLFLLSCVQSAANASEISVPPEHEVPVLLQGEKQGQATDSLLHIKIDLGDGVSMKLVRIPAGSFLMGSTEDEQGHDHPEGPRHRVTITRPFFMGIYEVTQEQYEVVVGRNPSYHKDAGKRAPVDRVSWFDAEYYCDRLSKKIAQKGLSVRLPTEAEWEYACRSGTTTPFSTGETLSTSQSNYTKAEFRSDSSLVQDRGKPLPVGSFRPNAFGLYDMHGNVAEWCSDYDDYLYYNKGYNIDPQGPTVDEKFRILRGGGYSSDANSCRSAYRDSFMQDSNISCVGFRVVIEISDVKNIEVRSAESKSGELPQNVNVQDKLTLDLGGDMTMNLVKIPAGKFMMGSRLLEYDSSDNAIPQHKVTITQPFYMSVYEVTQEQYEALTHKNPSYFKNSGANYPVETVTWFDAVSYCGLLSKISSKYKLKARLPSEAQWEYSCRAGTTTPCYFGDTISTDDANYDGTEAYGYAKKGENRNKTMPVGSFRPNAFGLYDMHGNVWEFCSDRYDHYYYYQSSNKDPEGPLLGSKYVIRGGSYVDSPGRCRSAQREQINPAMKLMIFGFRVAFTIDGYNESCLAGQQKDSAGQDRYPDSLELDLGGGVTMKIVKIPAGSFVMGKPEFGGVIGGIIGGNDVPQREVQISESYYMGTHEVTIGQYLAYLNDGGYICEDFSGSLNSIIESDDSGYRMTTSQHCISGSLDQPIVNVSWDEVQEYCAWLTEKNKDKNVKIRLPTEAEWEYACRAGSKLDYFYGYSSFCLSEYAWYSSTSSGQTHPVGLKKPNALGLYDMYGNASEWCSDWYSKDYYTKADSDDPKGPSGGTARVIRGGSWQDDPYHCRSSYRSRRDADRAYVTLGFRVVAQPLHH